MDGTQGEDGCCQEATGNESGIPHALSQPDPFNFSKCRLEASFYLSLAMTIHLHVSTIFPTIFSTLRGVLATTCVLLATPPGLLATARVLLSTARGLLATSHVLLVTACIVLATARVLLFPTR